MTNDRETLIAGIVYKLRQARDAATSDVIKGTLDEVIRALQRGEELDHEMLALQVNLAANDFSHDIQMREKLQDISDKIVNQLPLLLEKPPEPEEEPGADVAGQEA
jgi:hypothetical protein